MYKIVTILILSISTKLYSQENFKQSQGEAMYNPPFFVQYGYLSRDNDIQWFAPYIGVGMQPTKFSISFFVQTGVALSYKNFSWRLEYLHAFLPDLSLFDYKNIENYGQNILIYDFTGFRISSTTKFGNLLYAFPSNNEMILEQNTLTVFGIHQIFSLDAQIYNNDFIILTSMFSLGFNVIPSYEQSSFYFKTRIPLTFDFIHSKLGFMGTFFYSGHLSKNRPLIIGEKYSGYDEAIDVLITKPEGLFNQFYDLTGALDMIYRVYFRSLSSPFDRFYVAIGGNIGFGILSKESRVDLLYMGTVAFGYELYDTIPFELRFSLDQDKNFFFNISVVSPISHRFDSNLD